jgi:hypothetical protein
MHCILAHHQQSRQHLAPTCVTCVRYCIQLMWLQGVLGCTASALRPTMPYTPRPGHTNSFVSSMPVKAVGPSLPQSWSSHLQDRSQHVPH